MTPRESGLIFGSSEDISLRYGVLTDSGHNQDSSSSTWSPFLRIQRPRVGQDRSVGIETRYRLEGRGDRMSVGGRFSAPVKTGPVASPASYRLGSEKFLGVKRSGRGVDHPPPSSAEVKERVELHFCSPPLCLHDLFSSELYTLQCTRRESDH